MWLLRLWSGRGLGFLIVDEIQSGESGVNPLSAETQAASDEWLPRFTDFIPCVDLMNAVGGVVDNCF
jgi:hypothetical protein